MLPLAVESFSCCCSPLSISSGSPSDIARVISSLSRSEDHGSSIEYRPKKATEAAAQGPTEPHLARCKVCGSALNTAGRRCGVYLLGSLYPRDHRFVLAESSYTYIHTPIHYTSTPQGCPRRTHMQPAVYLVEIRLSATPRKYYLIF